MDLSSEIYRVLVNLSLLLFVKPYQVSPFFLNSSVWLQLSSWSGAALYYPSVSISRHHSHQSRAEAVLLGGIPWWLALETKDDPSFYLLPNPSILSLRSIFLRQLSALSSYRPIKTGVPQGSILAPLLYSVCIADVPLNPHSSPTTKQCCQKPGSYSRFLLPPRVPKFCTVLVSQVEGKDKYRKECVCDNPRSRPPPSCGQSKIP